MFNIEAAKKRLESLKYEVRDGDELSLAFCIEKVKNTIRNETNQREVPERLEQIAIDMTVGEFLLAKKTFSPADFTGIDLDYAVKQLQDGDTNIVFAIGDGNSTPEQRLTAFINYLLSYGRTQFSRFRRLVW